MQLLALLFLLAAPAAFAQLSSYNPESLISSFLSEFSVNPTIAVSDLDAIAASDLKYLSSVAATATGASGSSLKSKYSALEVTFSRATSEASALLKSIAQQSGSASASASASTGRSSVPATATPITLVSSTSSPSGSKSSKGDAGAVITGAPIAIGAVGMAILAAL